ncbi:MAG: type II toxin-antitoxin system antitoxin SocA domain-containing protein [Pseudomonadota bacterium]
MTTFAAAKTIAELWGRPITNLSLQKLLYLSHMVHAGRGRGHLASNPFQAWDYGPVEPELYHKLKAYGAKPIPLTVLPATSYQEDAPEMESILEVVNALKGASPRKLVSITHAKKGAWAKNYQPGVFGVEIPESDIIEEFNARLRQPAEAA